MQREVVPVTVGNGFTVMVNVNVLEHWLGDVPDVAVTLQVAITGVEPEFVKIPEICEPDPELPPVNPLPVGEFHEQLVPVGIIFGVVEFGVILNDVPLQTDVEMFEITGTGLTVNENVVEQLKLLMQVIVVTPELVLDVETTPVLEIDATEVEDDQGVTELGL